MPRYRVFIMLTGVVIHKSKASYPLSVLHIFGADRGKHYLPGFDDTYPLPVNLKDGFPTVLSYAFSMYSDYLVKPIGST